MSNKGCIGIALCLGILSSAEVYSSDLDLLRIIKNANQSRSDSTSTDPNSNDIDAVADPEVGDSGSTDRSIPVPEKTGVLEIEPSLSASDGTLSPSLTFSTTKLVNATSNRLPAALRKPSALVLSVRGNSSSSLEKPEDIVQKFGFDGGNINLELEYLQSPFENFGWSFGWRYASLTGSEIPSEGSAFLDVDSEVTSYTVGLSYDFNGAILSGHYSFHEADDNGEETEFTKLVDNSKSSVISVSIPFLPEGKTSKEQDPYLLKFERVKLEGVDESEFRVVIETKLK